MTYSTLQKGVLGQTAMHTGFCLPPTPYACIVTDTHKPVKSAPSKISVNIFAYTLDSSGIFLYNG